MKLAFDDSENRIYAIDTSGLINLEVTFPPTNRTFLAIWEEIEDLIKQGRFRVIDFVEEEINNYEGKEDFLKRWIKQRRERLIYVTDEECFNAAIPIINEEYATGFFNAKKQAEGKEEAAPYLIAYCIVNDCVLITNESKTKPNKIPEVARRYDVVRQDIYDFIADRNLKMVRGNK